MSVPIASERVLPTLNADGTRRRIRPKLYAGPRLTGRRRVAWLLMVLFAAIPWLEWNKKPLVLLDLPRREFTLFGTTFLPTDGVLLMLLLLAIFIAIIATTAVVGRAWCGWACPQTVYMEFLFRPIERLFEGRPEDQRKLDRSGPSLRRVAKNGVFLIVSFVLANVFLSYFVGVRTLLAWTRLSPFEHWEPFLVVAVTTGLVFFDFAFFREQMCTVACPYARLQSVLLDPRSLIVGYDKTRGEPRGKGKIQPGRGDCIDCNACVAACPTGIDIRDGLQLECIACAQCVDACDGIMQKIKRPLGLIRYGSQVELEARPRASTPARIFRPRVVVYGVLLAGLLVTLGTLAGTRQPAEVTVLRGLGAPFTVEQGRVTGALRVKVQNRGAEGRRYRLEILASPPVTLIAPENPLDVAGGAHRTTALFVVAPTNSFHAGRREIVVRVADDHGFTADTPYRLVGPEEVP
ncbi:MAG TPA: cytochrome c oxidase accessory protein CcoG [Polyangiaceae bacterium]|nr:cytochrome c oxidase accessory protein CcoG [Polyangiaceae bacterium]